jgi:hypothetical protein
MKKSIHLLLLLIFITSSYNSKAQSFLDKLIKKVEDKFNTSTDDFSNKIMEGVLDYATNKTEKILQVSSKSKDYTSNNLSKTTKKNNNQNKYTEDKNSDIPIESIENFIKENYPNFFSIYLDVSKDPLVKKISFVVMESHKQMCYLNPKSGEIIYDLHFFKDLSKHKQEEMKCWSLLLLSGMLHQANEAQDKIDVDAQYYIFDYTVHKAREYAEKGNCYALNRAVNFWKKDKVYGEGKKQQYKDQARAKIIQTDFFKDCETYFTSNCKVGHN